MNYELRLFDEVLLKFNVSRNEYKEFVYTIIDINKSKQHLLPIGLKGSPDSLHRFLKHRVIHKNREFAERIVASFGLSCYDYLEIISLCKGLSLNDSYWIVEEGFKGSFAEYNLFDNTFSRKVAQLAFTGHGNKSKNKFSSSPEFTTHGMLRKCWKRNDGITLYKGGTSGSPYTGLEPYSEFYATQVAKAMGVEHVDYKLKEWKGSLCSTCKLFTSKDISYVPIHRFVEEADISTICSFIQNLGNEFYEKFCDMLVFDSLIINTDRHFGNFGLLVDSHTNKILDFAPIFDNGLSLLCYGTDRDFQKIEKYASIKSTPYMTYDNILKLFLSESQKSKIRKLIGFKFKRHRKYNLPEERLQKLEEFLQKRINYILRFKAKN